MWKRFEYSYVSVQFPSTIKSPSHHRLSLLFSSPITFGPEVVRITGGRLALVEEEQILDDGVRPGCLLGATCRAS